MFFLQDAILDLHGPRSDYEPHLQSEIKRTSVGETFAHADTEFPGFITTTWPADRPHLPGDGAGIWIFILKYMKNPYANIILK